MDHLVVGGRGDRKTQREEYLYHRAVLGEGVGYERRDPDASCRFGETLEKTSPDAVVLVGIGHDEGDLGLRWIAAALLVAEAIVASDGDQAVSVFDDQRQPIAVVNVGEMIDITVRERGVRAEVAKVDRPRRKFGMESPQTGAIGRQDRPHSEPVAVGHRHVALQFGRVPGKGSVHRSFTSRTWPRWRISEAPRNISFAGPARPPSLSTRRWS